MVAWLVILFFVVFGETSAIAAPQPNVVFILCDDLGIGDVKCFGENRCRIPTPNFDRLAREGMRFTDAHPNVSHCVPTRIAIMTGRNPWRFANPKENGPWGYLTPRFSPDTFTLGDLMQRAGYCTGYVGKWHLGTTMLTADGQTQGPANVDYTRPLTIGPNDYGFDESFILPGSLDMFPYAFVKNGRFQGAITAQKGCVAFHRLGPAAENFVFENVLDEITTEAERFLAAAKDDERPFFLYLALTSPHTPVVPSRPFLGKSGIGLYGDFVHETDHCICRVLDALDALGLSDETLVVATSDHGAAAYAGNNPEATPSQIRELEQQGHYAGGIYRGYKFSIYEGGLRVPFVARWPGSIPAASHCDRMICLSDLMATFSGLTGVALPEGAGPDSISFAPLLRDPTANAPREELILQSTHAFAVRQGQWKLALCPGSGCPGTWGNLPKRDDAYRAARQAFGRAPTRDELKRAPFVQLFDLSTDPGETHNLADSHPERVAALLSILDRHIAQGRSTPGPPLPNDAPVDPFGQVPKFVFEP